MLNYHARWLLPVAGPPIDRGTVGVDGTRIAYVGTRDAAPRGEDVELGDVVLMPGLVDAHTRLELTTLRGLLARVPFDSWLPAIARARAAGLGEDALLDAARLGLAEGAAAGTTTYADVGATGASMRAMREAGVRGIAYVEVTGAAPDERAPALAGLADAVRRLRPESTELVRLGVAPHSVHAVGEDLLVDACAFALGARLPIALAVAESGAEIAFLREGGGPFAERLRARGIDVFRRAHSPVHLLVELGIDIARPTLVHGVRLDASDVAFVAERGCPVVHCPSSNAALGHGVAPVVELLAAGAVVGLGTGVGGGGMHLLDEARVATLLHRARLADPDALTNAQALELATLGGARALGLDAVVGSLEVGKDADLAAFPLTGTGWADDPAAALLAVPGRSASFVAVAGRPLVRDGRLLAGDASRPARGALHGSPGT